MRRATTAVGCVLSVTVAGVLAKAQSDTGPSGGDVTLDLSDPQRIAEAGIAALERYEAERSRSLLDEAISALTKALLAEPDHPDRLAWKYFLVIACGYRTIEAGSAQDRDSMLATLWHVWDECDGDPDVAADFAELLFRCCYALSSKSGNWDMAEASRRYRELVDDLDRLRTGGAVVEMIRGLVVHDLFQIGGDLVHRDEALALLGAALPAVPDDARLVADALEAYALLLYASADEDGAPADGQDRAIEALVRLQTLLPAADRPDLALIEGELRCYRGDVASDADELRRGIERLALFLELADPGDAQRAFCWALRAMAHERLWHLTQDSAERTEVISCCDAALALGLPDEQTLGAHRQVLDMTVFQLATVRSDGALAEGRERLAAAMAAFDARPDTHVGSRSELAMAIATLGVEMVSLEGTDPSCLPSYTDIARQHPAPPPEWPVRLATLDAALGAILGATGQPGYQHANSGGLSDLVDEWRNVGVADEASDHFALLNAIASGFAAARDGDPAAIRGAAIAACEAALAIGLPDDMTLRKHLQLLTVAREQELESGHDYASMRVTAARCDAAVAAFDLRPDVDVAVRAELAMSIAVTRAGLMGYGMGFDPGELERFIEIARRHPEPPPGWATKLTLFDAMTGFQDHVEGRSQFSGASAADMAEAWRKDDLTIGPDIGFSALTEMVAFSEALRTGDRAQLRSVAQLLAERPARSPIEDMLLAYADAYIANQDGAPQEEVCRALLAAISTSELATEPWLREHQLAFLHTMAALLNGDSRPDVQWSDAGDGHPLAKRLHHTADIAVTMTRIRDACTNPDELRRLLRAEEQRLASGPASGRGQRVLAGGWLQLARLAPTDPEAAESAVRWSAVAAEQMSGPDYPGWADGMLALAEAHRLRGRPGDRPRSRDLGLDALRGYAWQALLQHGTNDAVTAAHRAATAALEIAQWCVDDRAHDDAVRAIEAGRGLALHAATTTRSVADQLVALGYDDLAAEWTAAGGLDRVVLPDSAPDVDLHGDLRRRVLRALQSANRTILDPPDLARIRAALLKLGADALVYLIPTGEECSGRAVVVPAHDDIEVLDLPGLGVGLGSPLGRYAKAYDRWHFPAAARSRAEAAEAFDAWSGELTHLVGWAWQAAAGPVLDTVSRHSGGETPYVIAVPVGMLALVPWHAASRPVGDGVRYLVEDAVISYAASARLLCDVVEREPVDTGAALIVGNPTNNLRAAGLEAQAVREAFYPDADYLGTVGSGARAGQWSAAPGGAGSPAQVLDRITDPSRPCPLAHFACHARADASAVAASHLRLSEGQLSVGGLMDRAPTESLPLGTVLLAACTTNVAGAHYDEAFSLSTAFLAAGARTAVGSLWTVPDGFTSRLMFMVHHYLRTEGLRPVDAVRRAQLWMLDRYRDAPPTMPDVLLAAPVGNVAYEHPMNWAGLTHLGR